MILVTVVGKVFRFDIFGYYNIFREFYVGNNILGFFSFKRYKIDDVNKTSLEITLRVKICLEENSCVYDVMLLDKRRIPKPGCSWDFAYTIPGTLY